MLEKITGKFANIFELIMMKSVEDAQTASGQTSWLNNPGVGLDQNQECNAIHQEIDAYPNPLFALVWNMIKHDVPLIVLEFHQ
jgi:hypothetical protein